MLFRSLGLWGGGRKRKAVAAATQVEGLEGEEEDDAEYGAMAPPPPKAPKPAEMEDDGEQSAGRGRGGLWGMDGSQTLQGESAERCVSACSLPAVVFAVKLVMTQKTCSRP